MAATPTLRYVDPHRPRGRLYLAVARFSATRVGSWISVSVSWKLDPFLLQLTRGRFSTAGPLATGLLETRGARTGKVRRSATLYFNDGDRITIIASKRLWDLADRVFPEYAGYRVQAARAGRVIPIVQLVAR